MTYIVALTGGIGSGKTTVSNCFKKIGVHVIDADVITRNILKYNFKISYSIKKKIGKKVLNQDYSINRYLLRKHIFNNKHDRVWLENLLHPKIYKETKNQIRNIQSNWCLWVVPLLVEKKLDKKAHRILLVDAPIKKQIARIMKRDKINVVEAKKIISVQTTRNNRISISDDIIYNNQNYFKMQLYVNYLNLFYLYLSKEHEKKKLINIKKNYLTKFY